MLFYFCLCVVEIDGFDVVVWCRFFVMNDQVVDCIDIGVG